MISPRIKAHLQTIIQTDNDINHFFLNYLYEYKDNFEQFYNHRELITDFIIQYLKVNKIRIRTRDYNYTKQKIIKVIEKLFNYAIENEIYTHSRGIII
jgi:hypothetical protein